MDTLLIQFKAPMVSFGTVTVDKYGTTGFWPVRSMLTGFLASALGYYRTQIEELGELQSRLQYAVRCDRKGTHYRDFQITRTGKIPPTMTSQGWEDPGRNAQWEKEDAIFIRRPDYWTDVVYLVLVSLKGEGRVTLDHLQQAIRKPARFLYIGRACCHPTAPYYYGRREGDSLLDLLQREPELPQGDANPSKLALWPTTEATPESAQQVRLLRLHETKDWKNSVHTGESFMHEGTITLRGAQC